MYKPGLHIISEFQVERPEELCVFSNVKEYFDSCIKSYGLEKVGEVYHAFSGGGVYCGSVPNGIAYFNTYLA
jgi:hypothetical protein